MFPHDDDNQQVIDQQLHQRLPDDLTEPKESIQQSENLPDSHPELDSGSQDIASSQAPRNDIEQQPPEPMPEAAKANHLIGNFLRFQRRTRDIGNLVLVADVLVGPLQSKEGPRHDLQKLIAETSIVPPEQAASLTCDVIALESGLERLLGGGRMPARPAGGDSSEVKDVSESPSSTQTEQKQNFTDRHRTELKKCFFELLACPGISAETVLKMFSGGIEVKDAPPSQIAHAIASIQNTPRGFKLTLYQETGFFADGTDRAHVIKHEVGHIIATAVIPSELLRAEGSLSESDPIAAYISTIIANPEAAASLEHRPQGTLKRELDKFVQFKQENPSEAAAIARKQNNLAQEIIADRIANYIESGTNLENYLTLRFGIDVPGESNQDVFARERDLFLAIDAKIKALKPEDIQPAAYAPEIPEEMYWDVYDNPEPILPPAIYQHSDIAPGTTATKSRSVLSRLFDWLTGTNSS